MAQIDANRVLDAMATKLGRAMLDATITEMALADAERTIAELRGDAPTVEDAPKKTGRS
jgi:hypothetical protein